MLMFWLTVLGMSLLVFIEHQEPTVGWFLILGLAYVGDQIGKIYNLMIKILTVLADLPET